MGRESPMPRPIRIASIRMDAGGWRAPSDVFAAFGVDKLGILLDTNLGDFSPWHLPGSRAKNSIRAHNRRSS
jgi:hypothetical protein